MSKNEHLQALFILQRSQTILLPNNKINTFEIYHGKMLGSPSLDYHSKHSDLYERTAGRSTRIVAHDMLSTISPPITSSSYVLDNACGPAIVTSIIKSSIPSALIVCADLTDGMLGQVQAKIVENGWMGVSTEKQDLMNLDKLKDGSFSHVITNFGIQSLVTQDGDRTRAMASVKEMYRVLKTGGVCAISIWSGMYHTRSRC